MKELSLNILDITENSVKAKSTLTEISIEETEETLKITISDNGYGMSEETVKSVSDPFYTTRTTRSVGLGIPLLKMSAEQTGGCVSIKSVLDKGDGSFHGTTVTATFYKNHIDFTPLGDIVSTITTLIQGHPDTDFLFIHNKEEKNVRLDTREIRLILGSDIPLNEYEIIKWIEGELNEQYSAFN